MLGQLDNSNNKISITPALGLATLSVGSHPVLVVGPREAAWTRASQLELSELAGEPLVLPPDDFSLTRQVRDAFRTIGAEPLIVAQSGQWDFLVAMAAAGLGTTLIPAPLLARLQPDEALAVRALAEPAINWNVALIRAPDRYLSHAARAWLAVCKAVLTPTAMG